MSSSQLLAYGDMSKVPGNFEIECQECGMKQKNRAFCYFCHAVHLIRFVLYVRYNVFLFALTVDE